VRVLEQRQYYVSISRKAGRIKPPRLVVSRFPIEALLFGQSYHRSWLAGFAASGQFLSALSMLFRIFILHRNRTALS